MSLQAKLDAFKENFESGGPPYNAPREVIDVMHRANDELIATGQHTRALKVGDIAPSFELRDSEGDLHSSEKLLKAGPLVVSFYRGVWCPYCNLDLQALEEALPEITKRGASLVAVSPQTAANSRKAITANKLTFPILSDPNNDLAEKFGIKWKFQGYLMDVYKKLGSDLPKFNGEPSWTLPMPSRFVLAADHTVLYADVNPDYTIRPEPSDMFSALDQAVAR